MIPETYNPVTHVFQPSGSLVIICLLLYMLPAIDLDNQTGLQTDKISDIGGDHDLTPELITLQAASPEMMPQYPLCIG